MKTLLLSSLLFFSSCSGGVVSKVFNTALEKVVGKKNKSKYKCITVRRCRRNWLFQNKCKLVVKKVRRDGRAISKEEASQVVCEHE